MEEMVARVEECFLGREQAFGTSKQPWKWSVASNLVAQGVKDGEATNINMLYAASHNDMLHDASRTGDLSSWTNYRSDMQGSSKGLFGVHHSSLQHHQSLNSDTVPEPVQNDSILMNSNYLSSYFMAQRQAASAITLAPGRAGVNTLAPGLARNPTSESIKNIGSCSTPSFCVGSPSPSTVFPSHPSDLGSRDSSDMLLLNLEQQAVDTYSESRVQPQLSDPSQSKNSLSYSSGEERDAIVNYVDSFWSAQGANGDAILPELRFDAMLDDTADTGACGLSFPVVEMGPLLPAREIGHHSNPRSVQRGSAMAASLSAMTHAASAPDFCQSYLVGGVGTAENAIVGNRTTHGNKPSQLAIPAKQSSVAAVNTSSDHPARLCWSDESWFGSQYPVGSGSLESSKQPDIKSPTSFAGSSPSSPTTPLDIHLFASSTLQGPSSARSTSSVLKAEEIQKRLTEFNVDGSNTNKRSFSTMQSTSHGGNPLGRSSIPGAKDILSRVHGGVNTDKFDAAALSALLYSNNRGNEDFRSNVVSPPAPKQRRRHGTATDPQSIAARTRREKFTDRIRILQGLVPNGERLDTVHMLSQTFEYVRFLQHKVWDLYNNKDSMSEVKCEKWKEFIDASTGQVIV